MFSSLDDDYDEEFDDDDDDDNLMDDDDDDDDDDDEVEYVCIECGLEIGIDVGLGRDTSEGPVCEECDE